MNASIRVYPAAELKALDFAELMCAALIQDGVIQGCVLSRTNNEVHITSGRLVIKGRLAVVEEGDVERPELTTTQTCGVYAICDLQAEEPFQIKILTSSEYEAIAARQAQTTADDFNVDNSVWTLKLASVTVNPSEGVTSMSRTDAGLNIRKNNSYVSNMQTELDSDISTLTTNLTTQTNKISSVLTYSKKRGHSSSKFKTKVYTLDGVTIPAKSSSAFYVPNKYNGAIQIGSGSGTITPTEDNYIYMKPNGDIVLETYASELPVTIMDDQYGVPTAVDTTLETFGFTGVTITGASSGAANAASCVLQSFGFSGNRAYIKIRNEASSQAKLKVSLRLIFVQAE